MDNAVDNAATRVGNIERSGMAGALVESEIPTESVLNGQTVAAADWPRATVLVSIHRGDEVIVPRGDVILAAGDRITVFTTPAGRADLEALLLARPPGLTPAPDGNPATGDVLPPA